MRVQYYTPEGEKLPVAINDMWEETKMYATSRTKETIFFNCKRWNLKATLDTETLECSIKWGAKPLYASDFTKEELKDLIDEKDL